MMAAGVGGNWLYCAAITSFTSQFTLGYQLQKVENSKVYNKIRILIASFTAQTAADWKWQVHLILYFDDSDLSNLS